MEGASKPGVEREKFVISGRHSSAIVAAGATVAVGAVASVLQERVHMQSYAYQNDEITRVEPQAFDQPAR